MPSLLPSGSSQPVKPVSFSSFWIGLALAGGAIALSIFGFSLEGNNALVELPQAASPLAPAPVVLVEEIDATFLNDLAGVRPLHQVELTQLEGRQVYRIRATTYGDEILVDYITGKLISVREMPGKFVVPPPPMGESIIRRS